MASVSVSMRPEMKLTTIAAKLPAAEMETLAAIWIIQEGVN